MRKRRILIATCGRSRGRRPRDRDRRSAVPAAERRTRSSLL